MKKYFILAAAAAMMLSACSFDRDLDYGGGSLPEGPIPLSVGASFGNISDVTMTTRSNDVSYQSDKLIGTNALGLFIFKKNGTTITETAYEHINLQCTSPTQVSSTEY